MRITNKDFIKRGFAVMGVVAALAILGTIAAAVSAIVAANSKSSARQNFSTQGLYLTQSGIEFASRNTKALHQLTVPSRQLLGTNLQVSTTPVVYGSSTIDSLTYYGKSSSIAKNNFKINKLASTDPCVYLLGSGSDALRIIGTASFYSSGCGININSANATALTSTGTSTIVADYINVAGGYLTGSNTNIVTSSGSIFSGSEPFPDPMSNVNAPSYSACTYTNLSISGTTTLNPGVYCGGITITGTGIVTMNPGTYIIDGGPFTASGGAIINGSGITIALDGKISGTYATLNLTGSGAKNLSPPSSGTYAQVLVYQSRSAPYNDNYFSGSGALIVNGIIYLPNQKLTFGGNTATGSCPILVTSQLQLIGTSYLTC